MSDRQFPADLVLRTDRLTLRELREDDVDRIVAAGSDPVTQKWVPLPRPYAREHALDFVRTFAPSLHRDGSGLVRAIEADGVLAGVIDLKGTDWRARTSEIGYWTVPDVRGKGVMTEATAMLARWALTDGGLERVELRIAPGNTGSLRVAQRCRFVFEGIARNAGITHDGRVDLEVYSLVPADLE